MLVVAVATVPAWATSVPVDAKGSWAAIVAVGLATSGLEVIVRSCHWDVSADLSLVSVEIVL